MLNRSTILWNKKKIEQVEILQDISFPIYDMFYFSNTILG